MNPADAMSMRNAAPAPSPRAVCDGDAGTTTAEGWMTPRWRQHRPETIPRSAPTGRMLSRRRRRRRVDGRGRGRGRASRAGLERFDALPQLGDALPVAGGERRLELLLHLGTAM